VTAVCSELTAENLTDLPSQGRDFVIAGIVNSTRRITTRDGRGFIAAELQDLTGVLEVTVWPDVYDRSSELWVSGSIVLVQVRVRERGDRLSIGVQEVEQYSDNFEPPAWLSATYIDMTPPRRNGNGNGYKNGNGTNGNGQTNGNGNGHANEAPPPEPPSMSMPPDPVEGPPIEDMEPPLDAYDEPLDYMTSASASPAVVVQVAPPPPAPRVATAREALRLNLTESSDEDADQRRLGAVFRLLQSQPGTDTVVLTISTRDGQTVELSLPSATLDETLRVSLQAALTD
jgi:hypothetical protein